MLTKMVNGEAVPLSAEEEAGQQAVWNANLAAFAAAQRKGWQDKLDAAVQAIYDKPMRLSKEYEAREAAAMAYKGAGYSGTVPARVSGFATPAGMTAKDASDLILSQASQLRAALDALSDLRMTKYAIARAANDTDAKALFDAAMTQIQTIGASLA